MASLQNSNRLLESTISILDSGVHDFPRIKKILQCTRVGPFPPLYPYDELIYESNQHFELISEPTLYAAQSALADEIVPEVEHLLRRVEQHLAKMERREKALIAKSELQEGRLHQKPSLPSSRQGIRSGRRGDVADAEKMKILRSKKERLAHAVERLSLQVGHKVCDVSKFGFRLLIDPCAGETAESVNELRIFVMGLRIKHSGYYLFSDGADSGKAPPSSSDKPERLVNLGCQPQTTT